MRLRRSLICVVSLAAVAASPGTAGSATEGKVVSFGGVTVRVPPDWPVVDLRREPTRCARFDVNTVYLGHQGPEALCPAVIVGAAEAVHLEPWDEETDASMRGAARRNVGGEPARVDEIGRAGGRVVVGLERPRTIVRVTFGAREALADQIVASIRVTGAASPTPGGPAPTGEAPAGEAAAIPGFSAAQTQPAPLQKGIFAGDGFDTCANPSLEKMQAWLASPYRAIGIYVGGVNHGCKAQTLSADWVSSAARQGWSFLPLYVGRQAPCYSGSGVKIDPASAAAQGTAAANDSIAQADKFGLPTGSPLYFDMEAYSGNSTCINAVHTFLQNWTKRLHERGYVSGVYSSEASGVANLSAAYNTPGYFRPDVIWTAHWGESKRIFGHHEEWLPDSIWTNHQRIHQYRGGHVETWGGEQINIDNDLIDAPVVRFAAAPRWVTGNFDGVGGTDLVHLCCGDYANTWMSQGDGTYTVKSFRPWAGYDLQLPGWISSDVNGDARDDLVHLCCKDHALVWLSDGDGSFTVVGFRPWAGYELQQGSWAGLDFDGDGHGDLVHLCCKDYALVWLSNGDGSFTVKGFRPWAGYVVLQGGWAASDVDGDGQGDLVHLCCKDYALVWLSNGDGSFTVKGFRPWAGYGLQQGSWAGLDVDGDGHGDLVHLCCKDYALVWLSNGDGSFSVKGFRPWNGYVVQQGRWAASDVNGDGQGDLVHLCCSDYALVWLSTGDGSFTVEGFRPWIGYGLQLGSWRTGDADADGDGDLFHMCCSTRIFTWFSAGDGTYGLTASPI
ncbi:MAG: glycoside hydrolase domain-containing protein [Actinomycetota bacterium]